MKDLIDMKKKNAKNSQNDIGRESIALHKKYHGKISITSTIPLRTRADLSLAYTPGVGAVCRAIAKDSREADVLTWRRNTVAVVSDGSAVLGLGNIGPLAALPVMEGKCLIFKRFTGIDAIPIVLATQNVDEIVRVVCALEPSFGAIQLEDISAPRCFEIERRISEALKIPVMHDDQHGTAIVALAALINAMKVTGRKDRKTVRLVINGAGAAGVAIAKLLHVAGFIDITLCDTQGAIWKGRKDLTDIKKQLVQFTNSRNTVGTLTDALRQADVCIGVSAAGAITQEMVKSMARKSIIFALANPAPEILPSQALQAGAAVAATGRSDFPNQINNALVYPGLFRGMLDKCIPKVTDDIKIRTAEALAKFVGKPSADRILPGIFDKGLHEVIAKNVCK